MSIPSRSMWNILWTPAISVNKGCCSHQALSHCSHLQQCTLRGFRMEKNMILALDSQGGYGRNDFSEPDSCISPYVEKR